MDHAEDNANRPSNEDFSTEPNIASNVKDNNEEISIPRDQSIARVTTETYPPQGGYPPDQVPGEETMSSDAREGREKQKKKEKSEDYLEDAEECIDCAQWCNDDCDCGSCDCSDCDCDD